MSWLRGSVVLAVVAVLLALGIFHVRGRDHVPDSAADAGLPPPLSWLHAVPPGDVVPTPLTGSAPFHRLDLRLMGLSRHRDPHLVGRVGSEEITTREIASRHPDLLAGLTEPAIEHARGRGVRWLVERTALELEAKRARRKLPELLLLAYESLPAPEQQELEQLRARFGSADDPEVVAAALTMWRLDRWRRNRSLIVNAAAPASFLRRVRQDELDGGTSPGDTPVLRLGDRVLTQDEVHALAGMSELMVRREYYDVVKRYFGKRVSEHVAQERAKLPDGSAEAGETDALRDLPPVTDEELDAFLQTHHDYQKTPAGRELAREHMAVERREQAREAYRQRLVQAARVEFLLIPPKPPVVSFSPLVPHEVGPARARVQVVALQAFDAEAGVQFAAVLDSLFEAYGDRVRFVVLPHYPQMDAIRPYRAEIGLYCAQEQGRFRDFFTKLRRAYERPHVGELERKARQLGLDEARFRACVSQDRYLPFIYENRLLAERAGIEGGEPGLFVNGRFVEEPSSRRSVLDAIDRALDEAGIPRNR